MGYVFDFKDAGACDTWLEKPRNQYGLDLEIRLIRDFIKPRPGCRLLDIGCGTGASLAPFLDTGMSLTGIDPSPYMLDRASILLGSRVDLHRASAEDLPFEDNAFDTALFFTSLEFTDRPAKAIEEACRVAREQVVFGVFNRYAPLNMARRFKGFLFPGIYTHARFFSVWELKMMIHSILGRVPVKWRTTLQMPFVSGRCAAWVENQALVQKSYCGTFIGMRIKPVPKFRTRPMPLKLRAPKAYKPAPGLLTGREE